MTANLKRAPARMAASDGGGFTAVASTGSVDRDGEVILPGALAPLPSTVPVHVDHNLTVSGLVGRGRPYYVGDELRIDATFSNTPEAQSARQKAAEGVLDSMSIVFHGSQWRTIDGVRTCVKGELFAVDLVTIPSNRDTRLLSVRGYGASTSVPEARRVMAEALVELAHVELKSARRVLDQPSTRSAQQRVDAALREPSAAEYVRDRLRSLSR